jgi:hypothetical protein
MILQIKNRAGQALYRHDISPQDLLPAVVSAVRNGISLAGANLAGVNLDQAMLRMADLRGADLSGADLRNTDLRLSRLSQADLRRASLIQADLSGADLRGADLREADMRETNCIGAYFQGADLTDADFDEANLHLADLTGAIGLEVRMDAQQAVNNMLEAWKMRDQDTKREASSFARGVAAQAWCQSKTRHTEMDVDLAEEFALILEKYIDALLWCSGSADFGPGGKGEEGWKSLCLPLVNDEE